MMILGESPGAEEDNQRSPFTGPAGVLADKIWQAANLSTNDFYITNVNKCRPVAELGSGKQNYTTKAEQRKRCRPFLDQEIELIDPKLIVTLGRTATEAILGKTPSMGAIRGKKYFIESSSYSKSKITVFPMLHPAYMLHSQKDLALYQQVRILMWEDIQLLSKIIKEDKLDVR